MPLRQLIPVLALLLLAGCPEKPQPPNQPPLPKTEGSGAPQLYKEERQALEKAKGVEATLDKRAAETERKLEESR